MLGSVDAGAGIDCARAAPTERLCEPLTFAVRRLRRRMKVGLLLWLTLSLGACSATPSPQRPSCFHRSEAVEVEIGYCQAVRSGNRLYISGTAGQGDMSTATRSVYERLKQTLVANGLSFGDVVKENVYTTDLEAFENSKDIRKAFYGASLPAATWVQVQRLYAPSLVLEVELVAEYPK
jgi:2-iminobutanoate/2-iminopropanoate deaminase